MVNHHLAAPTIQVQLSYTLPGAAKEKAAAYERKATQSLHHPMWRVVPTCSRAVFVGLPLVWTSMVWTLVFSDPPYERRLGGLAGS